jgi:UDP-N-acetylmuramoylalanine--D-glutamate ligase
LLERGGEPWLAHGKRALLAVSEMKLAGLHNAANALAALALCRGLGFQAEPLIEALREFKGLPHRVEPVGEAQGVRWYDDSKGTNVGSTVAALAGLAQGKAKVVLIAGGEGKGQDFSPLKSAVARAARALVLIGRDAPLIEAAVAGAGVPIQRAQSMDEAVTFAGEAARAGDAVLLSPACASFDMFRNYKHRGEVFRAAVERRLGAEKH